MADVQFSNGFSSQQATEKRKKAVVIEWYIHQCPMLSKLFRLSPALHFFTVVSDHRIAFCSRIHDMSTAISEKIFMKLISLSKMKFKDENLPKKYFACRTSEQNMRHALTSIKLSTKRVWPSPWEITANQFNFACKAPFVVGESDMAAAVVATTRLMALQLSIAGTYESICSKYTRQSFNVFKHRVSGWLFWREVELDAGL